MTSRRETSCRAGSSLTQPFFQEKRKIINGRRPTADGRHNAAFTLLELLVVIAIIVILIGLLSVGLMGARRQALHKATKGRIAQLELAVQSFYDEFRVYPPDQWGEAINPAAGTLWKFMEDRDMEIPAGFPTSPDDNEAIECLVYAVTVIRPLIGLKKLEKEHDAAEPGDPSGDGYPEIWDAWGNPFHYVVPDSGTITGWGANSLTDNNKNWDNDEWINTSVKVGSQIRQVTDNTDDTLTLDPTPPWSPNPSGGDSFTVYFGNSGFVDIWSRGPDRVDDSGAKDDINNWERD